MTKLSKAEIALLLVVVALTLGVRLAHMTGPLDESSWRQSWSAYQARELARESPPEFLRVKINYKGTNDVSVWNFPVYEGLVGLTYKAMGVEEYLPAARLIALLFFTGSAVFLFLAVRLLLGIRMAAYTALAYLLLPVGIFYSRAVHYDMGVLFFSHGFFYFGLRYVDGRRARCFVAATAMAAVAFLMKPPYAFYFALPIGLYALTDSRTSVFRAVTMTAVLLILPFLAGWGMHLYRLHLDSGSTSSLLTPDLYSKDYARGFYFGALLQRVSPARWQLIARQAVWLVLTPFGALFALWAVFTSWRRSDARGWVVMSGLGLGVLAYVVLVFPMVSSAHTYYLLPLMFPAAFLIGAFLESLVREDEERPRMWRGPVRVALALLALLSGVVMGIRRGDFFAHDWQRIEAGRAIQAHTQPEALIVSTTLGRSTAHVDPRILYFADRRGWVIPYGEFTRQALQTYLEAGARYVALLVTPDHPAEPEAYPLWSEYACRVVPIQDPYGARNGAVLLFQLDKSADGTK